MDERLIREWAVEIETLAQRIQDEVDKGESNDATLVEDAADLQPALNVGGAIQIAPELTCHSDGGYVFNKPSTVLCGLGNSGVSGGTSPALRVSPEVDNIAIEMLNVGSNYDVAVLLGKNDTSQNTLGQAPDHVKVRGVYSSGHRGKRVIEVNAANVQIIDCEILDCYSINKQDSQAVCILNSPGPVLVEGCHLQAASECLMVGGDSMKIPNCRPTGITIRASSFTKRLEWIDDPDVPVKNLLELKDGHDVLIEDCDLSYCWESGQDGYAFMFTPANGASLKNVIVKNCRVSEVGGIVNITGRDANGTDRTQVEFIGGDYRTNKVVMGGSGRFCLIGRGPEWVKFSDLYVCHEGSAFIDCSDGEVIDQLHVINCDFNYGSYGLRINGSNHGDNSQGIIKDLRIEGNTITGAHSLFKDRYPDNIYLG